MKKLIFLIIILLCAVTSYAQFQSVIDYGPVHAKKLTIDVLVTSGGALAADHDSIWVQFADKFDFNRGWVIDTLNEEQLTTAGFDIKRSGIWSGYGEVDIKFTNVDLAADSLQILCYSINSRGEIVTNDYVYLSFATPPSYTTSANNLDWTDATLYRASITGAFGYGTQGLLFIVNGCDVTGSHEGILRFDIYLK